MMQVFQREKESERVKKRREGREGVLSLGQPNRCSNIEKVKTQLPVLISMICDSLI